MKEIYSSEEEFLKEYNPRKFDPIAVTTDILLLSVSDKDIGNYRKLTEKKFSLLLVKRDTYPYKDMWCLPGGFVKIDEDLDEAAKRVLYNETNIKDIYLEQLYTFSDPKRDPRMRVISSSYIALVDKRRLDGKISSNASWFDIHLIEDDKGYFVTLDNGIEEIKFTVSKTLKEHTTDRYKFKIEKNNKIAFDHPLVIISGIERIKNKAEYTDIVFNMMPDLFTLGELQQVYEVVLRKKLLDPAFRRIIANKVEKTEKMKINKIKLFVNNNIKSKNAEKLVMDTLIKEGFKITEENDFDLGIAIGGDGSFLRMIRESNFKEDSLFVGINTGTLGFAQDINLDNLNEFINELKLGKYNSEDIGYASIEIETKTKTTAISSLNEIVIRDEGLNTFHCNVYINDDLLENYVGDGLLISTSFGSTAYNLSFGGSIVYNTFDTLQITPIAPLNNKSYGTLTNSLIIPVDKMINLKTKTNQRGVLLTVDGNNLFYNDVISIRIKVNKKVKIIRKSNYNFIEKINDKFLR